MKTFIVALSVFVTVGILSIVIDFFLTNDILTAIRVAINPFKVMDIPEMVILMGMVFIYCFSVFNGVIKNLKNKKPQGKEG